MRKIAFLVFVILSFGCFAYEPPYPDIWGYDLSEYPAVKWGKAGIQAYRMDDGDIWFVVSTFYKVENPLANVQRQYTDQRYVLIKFFKGEKSELNQQERDALFQVTEGKGLIGSMAVHFRNGGGIKCIYQHPPKLCRVPDFSLGYYLKTDSKGISKKYSILGASPQVSMWLDKAMCEAQGASFLYQKLYLLDEIIDLGDDTFIAYSNEANLILRFDKDFNTKFKPVTPVTTANGNYISRNFFVIEYSLIEALQKKWIQEPVPLYQTIHDQLLLHFREQYPQ